MVQIYAGRFLNKPGYHVPVRGKQGEVGCVVRDGLMPNSRPIGR